ncbi:RagB/SusD family nutrient uptake outer membrane protein [Olivibacter sp. SDN3]|uniref:RagB/SusD family nutrient uptake outer membrane protein n=1 Tax=Olivibacter sp. SDN3 TaxID=2764720 RepID=UPI001650E40F|nr:RagB/SusD family nutrient uptake outer membrane protein [Olivibacter sp. SDN3]QNL52251.1 RagB/SusD family nutrient uptake outer membrane protein [Olivibacter sp. SDN3]
MKKHFNIKLLALCVVAVAASCKDEFLQEKRDFTGVNEQVYEDPNLAQAYVDYIYGMFLPKDGNGQSLYWELAVDGNKFSQNTEELAGQNEFNQPWAQISFVQNHALQYFGTRMAGGINNNTWTRLKQINLFLDEIDEHGLTPDVTAPLKGQLYFWRAWQYFDLVRLYGGVPIVLTPQNPIVENTEENSVPRSPTSVCIDQICADLDTAMSMLPGRWDGTGWGRITSGAAAALKGKVLLTWASPQFNRNDDAARWERAYVANSEAKDLLEANGFGLYKKGNLANGEAWGNMWFEEIDNPEAVMVYGFNNITADNIKKNNFWERNIRPRELNGEGSVSPTKQMVEAFPMRDGKMPGQSSYPYDVQKFYKNRDPRFYKTFVYNGATWPYRENPNYIQWSYRWYNGADFDETPDANTETLGPNASGIYLCKASDPNASNTQASGRFEESGTDVMKIRFAEVILNLAESAIGTGRLAEGIDGIRAIRERAGVENLDGNYGMTATGRDELFAAILNERRVEFAYEGHRYWDLRRWMLFDGNSPTSARLGLQDQALNGTRRTGYFFVVKNDDGTRYRGNDDPMRSGQDGSIVIDREPTDFPPGIENQEEYLDYLYDNYFEIVEKDDLDPINTTPAWTYQWFDEYYFFGLHQNILNTSPYLEQTQGWNGLNGMGTFDPLQ